VQTAHRAQLRSFRTAGGFDAVTAGATRVACARLSFSRIARSRRCSKSPTMIPRHRSAARITAAYIRLSTGRSPKACGTILVRHRSSRNRRSRRLVVRMTLRCRSGKRRCAMPSVQPLGDTVHKQVGHDKLAEIPGGEGFVLLPQPLGDLAHCGAAQQAPAGGVPKGGFDVARAQAAGEHLHRQALQLGCPPHQPGAHARHKRFRAIGPPGGTPYSIGPSAVRSRPRR
jgi:hypothetical protein